jgi:Do/DeqQ family serine protease
MHLRRVAIAAVLVGSGFTAGVVFTGRMHSAADEMAAQPPSAAGRAQPQAAGQLVTPRMGGLPDLSGIAAQAVKGVVNISSVQVIQRRMPNPFESDPIFGPFFGDPDVFGRRGRRELSLGSGVIVSSDGYVITNNHVVGQNQSEVTVSFGDKREVPADIVGVDRPTDLALLKIRERNLPALLWGDSRALEVGEWVLAIGSPFQLNQTVTLGIVSALGRANMGFAEYENFIQTDAAINPGNSGGALVNARGQLVGINTGILSQSGGYQGVGFAVPSELARHVIDDLIKYGEVRRGSFGYIEVEPVTTLIASRAGLQDTAGALVTGMYRTSQAYGAGIRPGDIIVSFDAQKVQDPGHLVRLVADAQIGSTAQVTVVRSGRSVDVRVPIVLQQENLR